MAVLFFSGLFCSFGGLIWDFQDCSGVFGAGLGFSGLIWVFWGWFGVSGV